MKRQIRAAVGTGLFAAAVSAVILTGCGKEAEDGKVKIEVVQYKQEAVKVFEELEKKFNETHDDIELVIDSPNDAMTILKQILSVRITRILLELVVILFIGIFWILRC